VWIQTELGLAELKNIHPDPILYRQATLEDLITIKDEDKVIELENRGRDEQLRVGITTKRQAMLSQGQNEKKSEIAALPKPLSKADHHRDIDKNRQYESAHLVEGYKPDLQELISPHISGAIDETHLRASPERPQQIADIIQSGLTEELADDEGVNPALEALTQHIQKKNEK
jgi:20S proteasome alpha/beta subunit